MAGGDTDDDFTYYETTTVDPGWQFTVLIVVICVLINLSLPLWLRAGDWWAVKRKLGAAQEEDEERCDDDREANRVTTIGNHLENSRHSRPTPTPARSAVSERASSIYSKHLVGGHYKQSSAPSSVVSSSVQSSTILSEVASVLLDRKPRRSRIPQPHRKKRVRSPVPGDGYGHDGYPQSNIGTHNSPRTQAVRTAAECATADMALQRYVAMYGDNSAKNNSNIQKEAVHRDDRSDVTPSVMSKLDVDDISVQDAVDAKDLGAPVALKVDDNAYGDLSSVSPSNGLTWNRMLQIADFDKEMRKFVALAIPFALQGLSVEFFSIVNVAIVGHFIGVKEANAFVVVEILLELTSTLTTGFAECIGVLVPHADGAGNDLLVGRYLQLGLIFNTIMTIPGVIIWAVWTKDTVLWFGFDEETADMGQMYAYTLLIDLFLSGISHCFTEFLNTLDHERYSTIITIVEAAAESLAIIIIGVSGVKDLVVVGLVQVAVGCIFLVIDIAIMLRKGWLERYLEGLLRTNGLKDRRAMYTVLITAIPLGLAWLLTFGEWEVMTLFAMNMGPAEVAAWGMIGYVWSAFETVTDGLGDAAEVRVGFRMGAGQIGIAKLVGEKSIYFGLVVAVFETGLVFIFAEYLPGWLTPDPTLQKLLFDLIPLIGFAQILMVAGMEAWAVIGAQGRVRLATGIEFVVSWFIAMPLAAIFVFGLNLNLESMVAALTIAYTVGANVYLYVLLKSDWQGLSAIVVARNAAEGVLYDEFDWDDLPPHIQQAAAILGYTEVLWDNDKEPEAAEKEWNSLSEEEKKAAATLGFNRKKWDTDSGSTAPDDSGDNYDDTDWIDLPRKVMKAAKTLGYTESLWNNDEDSPLDKYDWSELTVKQRKAAQLIGYNQRRWDEGSDALPSYDRFDWAELPLDVREAAKLLKYTQRIWDNDEKSPLDERCWNELHSSQQAAAVKLGYDQTKWDNDADGGDDSEDESFEDARESFDEEKSKRHGLVPPSSQSVDDQRSQNSRDLTFPSVQSIQRELVAMFGVGANRSIDAKSYGESVISKSFDESAIETSIEPIEYDEDEYWRNLPVGVQGAAEVLGYTQQLWDKDKEPPTCQKSWAALTPEEQHAAQVLGYNKEKWDDDDSEDS